MQSPQVLKLKRCLLLHSALPSLSRRRIIVLPPEFSSAFTFLFSYSILRNIIPLAHESSPSHGYRQEAALTALAGDGDGGDDGGREPAPQSDQEAATS
jgi:hypothetical protein